MQEEIHISFFFFFFKGRDKGFTKKKKKSIYCTQEVEREINSQKLFDLNIFIVLSVEDQRIMI